MRDLGRTHWRSHVHRLDSLKVVGSATIDANVEVEVLYSSSHIDGLINTALIRLAVYGRGAAFARSFVTR